MTINQQIDSIFKHPFFQLAMKRYQEGDTADLRQLFFEVHYHVYEKCNLNASRTYGLKRWLNTCDIKKEIKGTPPPDNLDLILPIPEKKPLQNTGKFENKKPTVKVRQFVISNQLNLFLQIA